MDFWQSILYLKVLVISPVSKMLLFFSMKLLLGYSKNFSLEMEGGGQTGKITCVVGGRSKRAPAYDGE